MECILDYEGLILTADEVQRDNLLSTLVEKLGVENVEKLEYLGYIRRGFYIDEENDHKVVETYGFTGNFRGWVQTIKKANLNS